MADLFDQFQDAPGGTAVADPFDRFADAPKHDEFAQFKDSPAPSPVALAAGLTPKLPTGQPSAEQLSDIALKHTTALESAIGKPIGDRERQSIYRGVVRHYTSGGPVQTGVDIQNEKMQAAAESNTNLENFSAGAARNVQAMGANRVAAITGGLAGGEMAQLKRDTAEGIPMKEGLAATAGGIAGPLLMDAPAMLVGGRGTRAARVIPEVLAGLGAATAVGGAITDKSTPKEAIGSGLIGAGTGYASGTVLGNVGKEVVPNPLLRYPANAAAGFGIGATGQAEENIVHGKPIGEGVIQAGLTQAAMQTGFSGIHDAFSMFRDAPHAAEPPVETTPTPPQAEIVQPVRAGEAPKPTFTLPEQRPVTPLGTPQDLAAARPKAPQPKIGAPAPAVGNEGAGGTIPALAKPDGAGRTTPPEQTPQATGDKEPWQMTPDEFRANAPSFATTKREQEIGLRKLLQFNPDMEGADFLEQLRRSGAKILEQGTLSDQGVGTSGGPIEWVRYSSGGKEKYAYLFNFHPDVDVFSQASMISNSRLSATQASERYEKLRDEYKSESDRLSRKYIGGTEGYRQVATMQAIEAGQDVPKESYLPIVSQNPLMLVRAFAARKDVLSVPEFREISQLLDSEIASNETHKQAFSMARLAREELQKLKPPSFNQPAPAESGGKPAPTGEPSNDRPTNTAGDTGSDSHRDVAVKGAENAKQPYEMSDYEYLQQHKQYKRWDKLTQSQGTGLREGMELGQRIRNEHREKVAQAIAAGKIASHPDYPELGKPSEPPPAPHAATGGKPVSSLPGKGIEYVRPDTLEKATKDWAANKLYVQNGQFRLKVEGKSKGPIAPYNAELKARGVTSEQLHAESQKRLSPDTRNSADIPSSELETAITKAKKVLSDASDAIENRQDAIEAANDESLDEATKKLSWKNKGKRRTAELQKLFSGDAELQKLAGTMDEARDRLNELQDEQPKRDKALREKIVEPQADEVLGEPAQSSAPPGDTETGTFDRLSGGRQAGAMQLPDPKDVKAHVFGEKSFVGQDVAPMLLDAAKGIAQAGDSIRRIFAPAGRSEQASQAAGSLREMGAELAQRTDRAVEAFKTASRYFDGQGNKANLDFIDKMESGAPHADPKLNVIAKSLRDILDDRRQQVQALGKGKLENFIENYFPHIWKDPDKASDIVGRILGKKPLEGSKSFLKQRTIPTIADGIAAGLEPVSHNPIDLTLLKLREMDKYILAQKHLAEMKDSGLVKFVRAGQQAPDGYAKINDKIAAVYGPREGAVKLPPAASGVTPDEVQVYGRRIMGEYYAPEPVATVINNYLSPGLREKSGVFRAYLGAGNMLNQAQLGFSAFHLGFTSMDTIVSKVALGIQKIASGINEKSIGKIGEGLKSIAVSPAAPLTTFLKGNKVLREWYRPGSQGADIARIVDLEKAGGGRSRMENFYRTTVTESMMKAFRSGNVLGGLLRTPFAAVEQTARPILEQIVPRQKLGVFMDLVQHEIAKLPPGSDRAAVRAAAGRVWDSVDNRMGQLVYDNLFWNKAAKDLAMGSVRSVGWNLGTWREIGGGAVKDLITQVSRLARGKSSEMTPKMAYTVALPLVVGATGAMINYLYTGQAPQTLKDYYFPRTGEKDERGTDVRLSLPSYMKDIVSGWNSPIHTVTSKLHPLIGTIADMLKNEDYYGVKIHNENDPLVKRMMDNLKYVAKQATPFSARGYQKMNQADEPMSKKFLPFIGVTPAARDITETPAKRKARDIIGQTDYPAKTPEDKARSDARRDLVSAIRKDKSKAGPLIQQAVKDKIITQSQAAEAYRQAGRNEIENLTHSMSAKDTAEVYKLGSDSEKKTLAPILSGKIARATSLNADEAEKLYQDAGIEPPPEMQLEHELRELNSKVNAKKKVPGSPGLTPAENGRLNSLKNFQKFRNMQNGLAEKSTITESERNDRIKAYVSRLSPAAAK